MQENIQEIVLSLDELHKLSFNVLVTNGLSVRQSNAMAKVFVAGQRDNCHSHGVWRLIGCVKTLRMGKLRGDAEPTIDDISPSLIKIDACFGFSALAFEVGSQILIEKAKKSGIAALAINNCFHFSALWPEVEAIAAEGVAALAMAPTHSCVAPAGGNKPLFGTNPIAFAWPRPGTLPFVFDMATSAVARGEIELYKRAGKKIPSDWAIDENGQATDDPDRALSGAMLTFGGYKGSALSAMVELLAGPLISDMLSSESLAFDEGVGAAPCHGELIVAFDPTVFGGESSKNNVQRAEALFDGITGQGARLPSQRRFAARQRSLEHGVSISMDLYDELLGLII
ncbi:Ldh family oxidoreductase [Paraburkholderia sp. BCC1886]|uniref:Ldh family oxidoreductase n=1 Tax=Paraburkholderia sp. BCC1886 TaxID=2562670 RepID=UPI00118389BE|nr:Ldh family oxidoreductase [Paraburkholderia sp. BCC1886]